MLGCAIVDDTCTKHDTKSTELGLHSSVCAKGSARVAVVVNKVLVKW
jgi:hypothetical protein